ncbi:hypothetical protein EJ03DRAFT_164293 [Teratosphaeria nubilosa]|uniref:Uncharacterized protein n=1 Tax=Teratosphaeria nubilosa TaxID=161662 RepID=A0A6G1L280_9PEZI|nr:hypothetical protein EJ03DRAFT_164293 [Teratosphaeria nubilosa]
MVVGCARTRYPDVWPAAMSPWRHPCHPRLLDILQGAQSQVAIESVAGPDSRHTSLSADCFRLWAGRLPDVDCVDKQASVRVRRVIVDRPKPQWKSFVGKARRADFSISHHMSCFPQSRSEILDISSDSRVTPSDSPREWAETLGGAILALELPKAWTLSLSFRMIDKTSSGLE